MSNREREKNKKEEKANPNPMEWADQTHLA
uniref:Uncharacterized protein n=1 Tax=Arundo donax TaxID=35708 RepID=A0A0A9FXP0_ARUDO